MADAKLARALVCCAAVAVVAAVLCVSPAAAAAAKGKKPAALPGVKECGEAMDVLSDCLDFVTPWSNATAPPASCCEGIKAVAKLNPWCLCTVLQESHKMDVQVDMSRADQLPAACRADVPDLGECKDYGATPAADGPAAASDDGDETASGSSSSPAPPATAVPPEASTPTAGGPVSGSDEAPVVPAPTAATTTGTGAPAPAPSASAAAAPAISSYSAALAAGLAVAASFHL